MNKTINITIKDKVARQTDKTLYICGNSDFTVNFVFDDDWNEFSAKTARFIHSAGYTDVVFLGDQCPIPKISNTHNIKVGVFAGDLRTTTPALISAKKSILCESGIPAPPSEDVYAQIMEVIIPEAVAEAEESAKQAAASEHNAKTSETNAEEFARNAAESAENLNTAEQNAKDAAAQAKASENVAAFNAGLAGLRSDSASEANTLAQKALADTRSYAKEALESEEKAAQSEQNAKTSEDKAHAYERNGAIHEINAGNAAQNAKESETNAAKSAEEAKNAAKSVNFIKPTPEVAGKAVIVNEDGTGFEFGEAPVSDGTDVCMVKIVANDTQTPITYSANKTSGEIFAAWRDEIPIYGYFNFDGFSLVLMPLVIGNTGCAFIATNVVFTTKVYDIVAKIEGSDVTVEFNEVNEEFELLDKYLQENYQPKGNYLTEVPEGYAKTEDIPTKPEDIGALPDTYTPPDQTAEQVGADPKGTAAAAVSDHNVDTKAHNDLRLELQAINNKLTAFFDSDDQTLDELSEIVAYITSNKTLIESITTSKVSVADIINNLTTNVANKPLSAAQGVVLKGLIDTLSKNLANYQPKGDYALRSELPEPLFGTTDEITPTQVVEAVSQGRNIAIACTDDELGAIAFTSFALKDNAILASGIVDYFIDSRNAVLRVSLIGFFEDDIWQINVSDLANYNDIPTIPTKVSAFDNDKGYLTEHQDISGKLDAAKLPEAVNDALAQAKASGEFDGKDYVLTDADKAEMVEAVKSASGAPSAVVAEASRVVDTALTREDSRILRFIAIADAHQKNDDETITAGTKELGQAVGEVFRQIGVDFVANLGDITWGSSVSDNATVLAEGRAFNKLVTDSIRGETQLWIEGNHETGMLTGSQIHSLIYSHNKGLTQDADHWIEGYGYMDFPNQKIRVICLNTNQSTGNDSSGVTETQLKWLAETALSMEGKSDWGVITMGHHPIGYNNITLCRDCASLIEAFSAGTTFSFPVWGSTKQWSINYSGKNCKYIGHFHGHAHTYTILPINKRLESGEYEELGVFEICIPNACASRTDQYSTKEDTDYLKRYSVGGMDYNRPTIDGKRTAFTIVTVCLDSMIIYADDYGVVPAGYDRYVYYGEEDKVKYSVTNTLTNVTSSNSAASVLEGDAYTATLTADTGYELDTVMVTMGGTDVTNTVYSKGVISISAVTGDIAITATATYSVVEPAYINLLPKAKDADGVAIYGGDYNGDGVNDGYKTDTYLSSGIAGSRTGVECTGFIPFDGSGNYVFYLSGITAKTTEGNFRFAIYNSTKTSIVQLNSNQIDSNDYAPIETTVDADGNITMMDCNAFVAAWKGEYGDNEGNIPEFFRLCAPHIDGSSIITVNQPIE